MQCHEEHLEHGRSGSTVLFDRGLVVVGDRSLPRRREGRVRQEVLHLFPQSVFLSGAVEDLRDPGEFLVGSHALPMGHVGELHAAQSVLVQLLKVDGEIQDPHEDGPFPTDRPWCCLGLQTGGDVGEPVLGRDRIEGSIAKARQQMCLNDGGRPTEVHPFLDAHGLPEQRQKVSERRGGGGAGRSRRLPALDLHDHGDRRFVRLMLREIVSEQRPVALALPADVEIERQSLLGVSGRDRIRHVMASAVSGAAMINT